jgi:hypothetical protein
MSKKSIARDVAEFSSKYVCRGLMDAVYTAVDAFILTKYIIFLDNALEAL